MLKKYCAIFVVVAVIALCAWIWYNRTHRTGGTTSASSTLISEVFYKCDGGKTINASYYKGAPATPPQPGQPPTPTGSVALVLSDGRQLALPQTISGSGIRYANGGESFIFWGKGDGAFVLENNQQTYSGCIRIAPDPGGLPQIYENGSQGFSLRYPTGYTSKTDYQYSEFGPGKEIGGVSFTIPASLTRGTNLGADSYVSVEEIPQSPERECAANLFLEAGAAGKLPTTAVTESGVTYSVASSTGAGAGNRYAETVYAIPGTGPCVAVRYFIHYSVFENYPPGTVRRFDEQSLLAQFDAIRRTLVIQQ